jgi:PAS domain S-box-containing protein
LRNISQQQIYQQLTLLVVVVIFWAIAILMVRQFFQYYIISPLKRSAEISRRASKGDLSEKIEIEREDEIGQIANSLDCIIQNQLNLAEFAEELGEGNFEVDYEMLSDKDKLGMSITGMRDKLQKLAIEDDARNWVSAGLSRFGEILREDDSELNELSDKFLSSLVKYINANQGMVFMLNDSDDKEAYLELLSAYAWNRKKFVEKKVTIGEGLIGQAAIEKDKIYITDVPEEFITITSGLGDATPRCVLIVPMISNDELFGVIELASFNALEEYEIEFVEKLAEILASTISRLKTNEQTQKLLRDSQQLTEELRAQEEEMRQNLEEMHATQEEMQQREVERIGIFTAINNTLGTVEFDMDGNIITANDKFLEMMNYTLDEIENKTDRMFADRENESIDVYNAFWKDLRKGNAKTGDFKRISKSGREIWVNASYTPALDKEGLPYKVIELVTDITEKKMVELETKRQADELRVQGDKLKTYTAELEDIKRNLSDKLNEASLGLKKKIEDIEAEKAKNEAVLEGCVDGVISFDQDGNVGYFNSAAEEIWGLKRQDILGKNIKKLIPLNLEQNGDGLAAFYQNNGTKKEIDVRTEVSFQDEGGTDHDLLVTLTKAKVNGSMNFTIFAQQISVDLF